MKRSKNKRNRSKSGAQKSCPHCGKKLRGDKGLKMHITQEHQTPKGSTT